MGGKKKLRSWVKAGGKLGGAVSTCDKGRGVEGGERGWRRAEVGGDAMYRGGSRKREWVGELESCG